jgi:hypothetical protein
LSNCIRLTFLIRINGREIPPPQKNYYNYSDLPNNISLGYFSVWEYIITKAFLLSKPSSGGLEDNIQYININTNITCGAV